LLGLVAGVLVEATPRSQLEAAQTATATPAAAVEAANAQADVDRWRATRALGLWAVASIIAVVVSGWLGIYVLALVVADPNPANLLRRARNGPCDRRRHEVASRPDCEGREVQGQSPGSQRGRRLDSSELKSEGFSCPRL